ncbi:hypothetical protein ACWD8L_37200 [Streptomyces sp. NPDC005133]
MPDDAFTAAEKGMSEAEITMAAYARKYVRELREMNYPHSEDIVNSHWSDHCSTLFSGIWVNSKRIVRSQPPSKETPTSTVFEFS